MRSDDIRIQRARRSSIVARPLESAVWLAWLRKDWTKRRKTSRRAGRAAIVSRRDAGARRRAWPSPCTIERFTARSSPSTMLNPVMPSLPIRPTSTRRSGADWAMTETSPLSRK